MPGIKPKLRPLFIQAYLVIMALAYPLYIPNGYGSIGRDKYFFYKNVTMSVIFLVTVLGVASFLRLLIKKQPNPGRTQFRLTAVQGMVFLFMGTAVLSYAFSSFRETAWSGAEGWYMGLETLLLILAAYLLIARCWVYTPEIWLFFLAGALIVYGLGICNRFSLYPIPFAAVAPDFISTLGNINWFAGYFAVMWPVGAGLYLFAGSPAIRIAAAVSTAAACGAGVIQGSSSVFLSFMAVFYVSLFMCLDNWKQYGKRWTILAVIWCLSCQIMRLGRTIFPAAYNYETNNLCGMVTGTSFSLLLLAAVLILTLLLNRYGSGERFIRRFKLIYPVLPAVGAILLPLLIFMNTWLPDGLPGFRNNSFFLFNQAWGNARGAAWGTGVRLFANMNIREKLIGAGPDCFVEYLYQFPDILAETNDIFGGAILKNAHNEEITMLINNGLAGTLVYLGIFLIFIRKMLKEGKRHQILYMPVLCVCSYLIHNIVSFGQVLNMPFVFIIMAIGEKCEGREEKVRPGSTEPNIF